MKWTYNKPNILHLLKINFKYGQQLISSNYYSYALVANDPVRFL